MSEGRMMTDVSAVKEFVSAGRAKLTIVSKVTGARFSYRVAECENKEGLFFVSVLTGSDNEHSYSYMGCIRDGEFSVTRKSRISAGAPAAMAWDFFWKWLQAGKVHHQIEVWHEGSCGRCGRTLTVPESIDRGIGPECAGKMGGSVVSMPKRRQEDMHPVERAVKEGHQAKLRI